MRLLPRTMASPISNTPKRAVPTATRISLLVIASLLLMGCDPLDPIGLDELDHLAYAGLGLPEYAEALLSSKV